jgi:Zn-dependent protease with chaperone function
MSTRAAEIDGCRVFSSNQLSFPDISYTSFVYPGDEEALAVLKHVPGAPALLTYLQKHFTEGVTFVENNQQMIRANTQSFFSIHKLVARCSEILSCPVPDVYITNSPIMNAYTAGHRHTCIVLHSALIEALTADELSFVIGHEMGHIKCGHGLYRQLGDLLIQYWDAAASVIPIPGIGLIRVPLLIAFWEWYRRAELTCDRAGLLCVQATQPAMTALGRLAGKVDGFEDEFNIDSAISQSSAHKEVSKIVRVVSILNNSQNTHPFIPDRLRQLRDYSQSTEYQNILDGQYDRDPLGIHEGGVRILCKNGHEVNAKFSHCPECGEMLDSESAEVGCTKCGNILAPEAKYCPRCGAPQEVKSKGFGFFKRRS